MWFPCFRLTFRPHFLGDLWILAPHLVGSSTGNLASHAANHSIHARPRRIWHRNLDFYDFSTHPLVVTPWSHLKIATNFERTCHFQHVQWKSTGQTCLKKKDTSKKQHIFDAKRAHFTAPVLVALIFQMTMHHGGMQHAPQQKPFISQGFQPTGPGPQKGANFAPLREADNFQKIEGTILGHHFLKISLGTHLQP